MALGTDSCVEIDGRAIFGAFFCADVDLERGIDGGLRGVDRA